MLKQLIKPLYRGIHDVLNASPVFPKERNGKKVAMGHISDEHMANPELDDQLAKDFKAMGVSVEDYSIVGAGYQDYLKRNNYPETYYGGGKDPNQNFTEKTLEHFVSLFFLNLKKDSAFMDIAACTSPFYKIIRKEFGCLETYQQDLIFPHGINGDQIGGSAGNLPLEDNSIDAATLHCSLEHFENDADTLLFQDMERVLRPGGRVVVLPFYLAHEFTNHVDPAFNLLRNHPIDFDKGARVRYCNWYQFFSRHYSPLALKERVLDQAPGLQLTLYRVQNFKEVYSESYLRWIGVFEKR